VSATAIGVATLVVTQHPAAASNACPDTMAVSRADASVGVWTNCATTYHALTTPIDADDEATAISPDHTKVAFTRVFHDTSTAEVFVVPISGDTPVQVTSFGQDSAYQNPTSAWSPNSAQLVVSLGVHTDAFGNCACALYKANADGSGMTLFIPAVHSIGVAWCGNKIVFVNPTDLFSINASDGSGLTNLTNGAQAYSARPACSPNGHYVFYDGFDGAAQTNNIYAIPLVGGTPVRLTNGSWDWGPTVSNDWTLAYMSSDTHTIILYWLGDTQIVGGPDGFNPAFVPGDGTIAPPAAFSGGSTTPPPAAYEYAALGDSYSSGEGAPGPAGYIDGTDVNDLNKCHRSDRSYSNIDAHLRGMPPKYTFHACSGAIIQDFFTAFPQNHHDANTGAPQNPTETHPQLDWIGPQTRVITLTVGGNDALFPEVMQYCAGRAFWEESCQSRYSAIVDEAITNLSRSSGGRTHDNLPDLYSAIRAKASSARVYVLGYPRFFPPHRYSACFTGVPDRFFSGSDMQWINAEIAKIDGLIKASAQAAGFAYVDVFAAFNGHELCTQKPYLNSARLDLQESYHPNLLGQAKFAEVLRTYLP
jgi:hypothetical protein